MIMLVSSFVHYSVLGNADEQFDPPMELLEFLGQWTDEQGGEIDFESLDEAHHPEVEQTRHLDRSDRPVGDQF